jgi:K+-sensing histidine kinase KdpD
VEDYQRVSVRDVEPATILGLAAADLAHLLAELIENALTFSDAHLRVDVKGGRQAGGYVLAVIDTGTGMDGAALDVANRRLAGAESFTVAPSKYLGHYVAGNLAARHGIAVRLMTTPGRPGITATVALPSQLLVGSVEVPSAEAPPLHAAYRPVTAARAVAGRGPD